MRTPLLGVQLCLLSISASAVEQHAVTCRAGANLVSSTTETQCEASYASTTPDGRLLTGDSVARLGSGLGGVAYAATGDTQAAASFSRALSDIVLVKVRASKPVFAEIAGPLFEGEGRTTFVFDDDYGVLRRGSWSAFASFSVQGEFGTRQSFASWGFERSHLGNVDKENLYVTPAQSVLVPLSDGTALNFRMDISGGTTASGRAVESLLNIAGKIGTLNQPALTSASNMEPAWLEALTPASQVDGQQAGTGSTIGLGWGGIRFVYASGEKAGDDEVGLASTLGLDWISPASPVPENATLLYLGLGLLGLALLRQRQLSFCDDAMEKNCKRSA